MHSNLSQVTTTSISAILIIVGLKPTEDFKMKRTTTDTLPTFTPYSHRIMQQVVKVVHKKAASLPQMDASILFARLRQCAPHLKMLLWTYPSPHP